MTDSQITRVSHRVNWRERLSPIVRFWRYLKAKADRNIEGRSWIDDQW